MDSINLYTDLLDIKPFSLPQDKKDKIILSRLIELTEHHKKKCVEFARMMDATGYDNKRCKSINDIPYIPVSLFKDMELKSIAKKDIFKITTSSGTTGQRVSKIFLDKKSAAMQQKTLVKIVSDFIGTSRMPMLIIDCSSVIKDRAMFSARGAGILGFSIFGADKTYALDNDMNIDFEAIERFLDKHKGERVLIFGFTFMIWQHFYKELCKSNKKIDLSDGILIHGGGWKKLVSEAVSKDEFKKRLKEVCGLEHIHDYYGMVEQTGCIYIECEHGHLHASNLSDIIIRNPIGLKACNIGERGIIQVVSVLPESYPGHSLLTEDEGTILGIDECPCGRKGKYFEVHGRIKNAEIRGCSDTYAAGYK